MCAVLVFCSCYSVISAVRAKHGSAALPRKQFVNKRLTHVNNHSFIIRAHIIIRATSLYAPTLLASQLAINRLFSPLNTRAKTNHR